MRFEWSNSIRNRRWQDFEALAKKQPSQQLCDTVNELLKGIEEPNERKILKKALYLVKLAGFNPSPELPQEPEAPHLPKIGSYGIMLSPDGAGYVGYFFGIIKGADLHYTLIIAVHRYNFIHVIVGKVQPLVWPTMRDDLLKDAPAPLVAEVDPAYVLHRIRRDWEKRREDRTKGKFNAFWKQLFTHVPTEFPHPAASFPESEDIGPERRRSLMQDSACIKWRLHFPPDDPLWEPIHAIRWDEELESEERKEILREMLMTDSVRLCSKEELEDMIERFHDCALILGQDDPKAGEMVHAANHLKKHRWRSEIFEQIVMHTVEHLEDDLEKDDVEKSAFPMGKIGLGWGEES